MSAFPQICLGCGRTFKPAGGEKYCPLHPQPRKPRRPGQRNGSTRQWRKLRAQILAGNPPCHYCGNPADQVDHRIPVALGGTDDPANLVPCCRSCNMTKGAKRA